MDPRPNLPAIVRCTEKAFELSEATNTPVMMELRIRACHVTGEFLAKDNQPPAISRNHRLANPAAHNYDRISHPPSTYAHEKIKVEVRQPAAQRFIVEHGLNELLPGERVEAARDGRAEAQRVLGGPLPLRPPGFCVGCPERPVFSAIKLLEREVGKVHISSDIGCHSFATLAPFNLGNSILGFGMSLAAAGAVAPVMQKRTISVMGDGGFWHNGLLSGVASAMFNRGDRVLVIMQNGYTSATGAQFIPNTAGNRRDGETTSDIAATLKAMGVKWLRTIRTYNVGTMLGTLREAMSTDDKGLKVIVADGECQLARQRRVRPEIAAKLKRCEREVRTRS